MREREREPPERDSGSSSHISSLSVVSTVRTCLCAPETEPVRFPAKNPETETGKYPDKSTVRISFLHSEKAEVQSFSTMYDTKYVW